MKRGLKRVRRAWLASLLAVVLLIPVGILSWNEFWGTGVCFTNLNNLWIAHTFMRDLKRGEYEKAFSRWDLEDIREYYLEQWFEEDAKEYFLASAQQIIDVGGITDYRFLSIRWGGSNDDEKVYDVEYSVTIDGKQHHLQLSVVDEGVHSILGGTGYISDPDALTQFALWSEYLWQHYADCYIDFDLGEYVCYDAPKS